MGQVGLTHKLRPFFDVNGVLSAGGPDASWTRQCLTLSERLHIDQMMLERLPSMCLQALNAWLDAESVAVAPILQRFLLRLRTDFSLETVLICLTQLERNFRQTLWKQGLSGPDWVALSECLAEFFDALIHEATDACRGLLAGYQHLKDELRAVRRLSESFELTSVPAEQWQAAVQATARLLHCEFCAILLPDEQKPDVLTIQAAVAPRILERALNGMAFPLAENGLIAQVFLTGAPASTYQGIEDLEVTIRRRQTLESLGFSQLVAHPLQHGGRVLGVLCLANRLDDRPWQSVEDDWVATVASQLAVSLRLVQMEGRSGETVAELVEGLMAVQRMRDEARSQTSTAVAQWARQVGGALGLPQAELDLLEWAASLHDWGEVFLPDAIRHRPGPYWPEDWAIVKRHAELGADFIGTFKSLTKLVPAIRHHHERWDGLGYPDGLRGEDIPLAARIIAAADAFVAMTESRAYRMQLDGAGAMAELLDASGTQFDPAIIRVMHDLWGQLSPGEPKDVVVSREVTRDPNGSWVLETYVPRLLGLLHASLEAADERDFYDTVWQVLSSHCELAGGALWCVRDGADLVCVDVYGFLWRGVDIGDCDRGLERLALRERVAVGSSDLMNDSRFRPGPWVSEAGFGVAIALPLIAADRVQGVLTVYRGAGGRFNAGDQAVLELGAAMVARGLDGLRRASDGDGDAQKDALTGLNSERAFAKALHAAVEQASIQGHSCGVILIDINGFDELNARYGFDWGDAVLRRMAQVIVEWLPAGAIAARSGADDFVILLPLVSAGDVMVHAESLRRALATLSDGVEQGESTGLRICIGVTSQAGTACVSRVLWQDVRQALQRAKDEMSQRPVYLARTHP